MKKTFNIVIITLAFIYGCSKSTNSPTQGTQNNNGNNGNNGNNNNSDTNWAGGGSRIFASATLNGVPWSTDTSAEYTPNYEYSSDVNGNFVLFLFTMFDSTQNKLTEIQFSTPKLNVGTYNLWKEQSEGIPGSDTSASLFRFYYNNVDYQFYHVTGTFTIGGVDSAERVWGKFNFTVSDSANLATYPTFTVTNGEFKVGP
ncbi:MAG TPA: hypothetical protein VFA55_01670 [Candidatus Kapabacteria bacterium]|nr:hypothetical protein [Candidatus Kapabacteria bacterium]